MGETKWRTEPTPVEKLADELWLAEKFQSNLAIAGSPRNSFRASVERKKCVEVEHWIYNGFARGTEYNQTANATCCYSGVRPWGISSMVKRETAQTVK